MCCSVSKSRQNAVWENEALNTNFTALIQLFWYEPIALLATYIAWKAQGHYDAWKWGKKKYQKKFFSKIEKVGLFKDTPG